MKTTKRIIIRIIVAVAVAFILSKLKLIGIMDVSALSTHTLTATQFCVSSSPSASLQCDNNLVDRNYYARAFKSYTYYGNVNLDSVRFGVTSNTSPVGKPMYISGLFLFWGGNVNDSSTFPVRVYINTGNRNFACKIEYGNFSQETGYSKLGTFFCENVLFEDSNAHIYFNGPFANYDSLYAIGNITGIYDNNVELMQQATNERLNELKNLINNTNTKLDTMIELQRQQNQTQTQIQNNTKETNDLIKSDDTTESNAKGKEFFDNFENDSHGLSGIITAPFRLLNSLTTQGCSPLIFDLPFDLGHVSLPCMRGIYEQHFGIFFSLWQMITTGLISYNVILNIYSKVRSMQNPYNDRIEVLNL